MADHPDSPQTNTPSIWFKEWFNHPLYLEVYSHRNNDEAASCIQTILSHTGLELKDPASLSILDIACGAGRHALELARLGYTVTGNDLSPFLLEEARKEALNNKLQLKLTCCDMRNIPPSGLFDLVVQLFTSFGYFDLKEDDLLVLSKAYGALKYGGWYVLDLLNPSPLARNLVSHSSRTVGDLTILEERAFDNDRITKQITITPHVGETLIFSESVRLYGREEIQVMLQGAGFTVAEITGNYNGEPFIENDSPRMMLFCRKK
ncbi:MAG: methyltransferase domain-containing protein [Chlorobiaceae bacterium]|jgi:SAM-dependent methyltransferase|nr:methyltransferase domain-containing protein [Chlorobiaceae bacterium]NTV15893.1 methyltransferase domain-containing protein [Chlorobiaceae bacterium]